MNYRALYQCGCI